MLVRKFFCLFSFLLYPNNLWEQYTPKLSAMIVKSSGIGVGISRYQRHHSRPANIRKIDGAMIKGNTSLSSILWIFSCTKRLALLRKLSVLGEYIFVLGLMTFRCSFGIGIIRQCVIVNVD